MAVAATWGPRTQVANLPNGITSYYDESTEEETLASRSYPRPELNGVNHRAVPADASVGKAIYDYSLGGLSIVRECQFFTKLNTFFRQLGWKSHPLLSLHAEKCAGAFGILNVGRLVPVTIDAAKAINKLGKDITLANFWATMGKVADAFAVYISAFVFLVPLIFLPPGVAVVVTSLVFAAEIANMLVDTVDLKDEIAEFQKYRPAADKQEENNLPIHAKLQNGTPFEQLEETEKSALEVEAALRSYQRAAFMKGISKIVSISLAVFSMIATYVGYTLGAGALLAGIGLFNVVLAVGQAVYKNSISLKFVPAPYPAPEESVGGSGDKGRVELVGPYGDGDQQVEGPLDSPPRLDLSAAAAGHADDSAA